MMQHTIPFTSWQAVTRALEIEFGPSIFDCPRASLFKLVQSSFVNDYYLKFMSFSNKLYGISAETLLDYLLVDYRLRFAGRFLP